MNSLRQPIFFLLGLAALCFFVGNRAFGADKPRGPNVVLILADDLGYADLGCYGQKKIRTPYLDRMAGQGMRFTQFYAGNAVCAPSRCCLMTGRHAGHAFVRTNREIQPEGQVPLPAETVTIAKLLQAQGYATAAIGKWGLGPPGTEGDPIKQGFDLFFGYNCQRHAHNYYPRYLWRNEKKIELAGNDRGRTGKQYSHDLLEAEALGFIQKNKDRPFFLYLPFTIPHVALQVPDDSLKEYLGKWEETPYKADKGYLPHDRPRAAYAAMITRMDRSVGRVIELLGKLGLDENTLVLFSSDNGPVPGGVGGSDMAFFESAGPLRAAKGSLFEGGIRVPFLARWLGKIKAGTTSNLPAAFYDLLPTLCDIGGAGAPKETDGLSFAPTLLGRDGQKKHEFLYWEFPSSGGQQAVRMGDWKGVRQQLNKGQTAIQLYNLADNIGEKKDVAAKHPEIVERIARIMGREHTPSKLFPIPALDK